MDISSKADRDAVLIAISSILQGGRSVGQLEVSDNYLSYYQK